MLPLRDNPDHVISAHVTFLQSTSPQAPIPRDVPSLAGKTDLDDKLIKPDSSQSDQFSTTDDSIGGIGDTSASSSPWVGLHLSWQAKYLGQELFPTFNDAQKIVDQGLAHYRVNPTKEGLNDGVIVPFVNHCNSVIAKKNNVLIN